MKFPSTISLVSLLIAITSCSGDGDGFLDKFLKGGGSAVPVTVENVITHERSAKINVPATLEASESVNVSLPDEVTVEKILVSQNDLVEPQTPLFKISNKEGLLQSAKLRVELKEAQTTLEKNQYILKNRDRLLEEGRIDQGQYDSLEADVAANEAAVERLKQEIAKSGDKPADSTITSPISGMVTKIHASPGVSVTGGKPIISVSKLDPMNVSFELASYDSQTVQQGMSVNVLVSDLGETIKAQVVKISPAIDMNKGTFKVWAQVANQKNFLKIGMPVEVEFKSPEKQRFFLIPENALIKDKRKHFVFTVIGGVAHRVEVVPGEKKQDRIEVVKGLKEDDIVVVKGHDKLTEGTVVDIWGR